MRWSCKPRTGARRGPALGARLAAQLPGSAAEGVPMAMRKVGSRRIVVDGVAFLWRAPRRPTRYDWDGNTGITVTVQGEDRRGSLLSVHFRHRHPKVAQVWGSPVISVIPSQVAAAIRRAIRAGW